MGPNRACLGAGCARAKTGQARWEANIYNTQSRDNNASNQLVSTCDFHIPSVSPEGVWYPKLFFEKVIENGVRKAKLKLCPAK